jgi:hypothetical protein
MSYGIQGPQIPQPDIGRKWSFFLVSEQLAFFNLVCYIHSMDWYISCGHYCT